MLFSLEKTSPVKPGLGTVLIETVLSGDYLYYFDQKWVRNIQAAGYNGAHTVDIFKFLLRDDKLLVISKNQTFCEHNVCQIFCKWMRGKDAQCTMWPIFL